MTVLESASMATLLVWWINRQLSPQRHHWWVLKNLQSWVAWLCFCDFMLAEQKYNKLSSTQKIFNWQKRGSLAIWQHTRLEDSLQKIAGFLHKSSTAQTIASCHTAEVCIICHLLCLQENFLFSDSGMCDGITSIPHNCQPRAPFSKVLETFQA